MHGLGAIRLRDTIETKKAIAHRMRLEATFIENVLPQCPTCVSVVRISYLRDSLSELPTEQLKNLIDSDKPFGVLCCECLVKQLRFAARVTTIENADTNQY